MCPAVLLRKGEMDIPTCLENGARRDTPETGYPGENWGPAKRGRGRRPPQILLYFLSLKCCECMAFRRRLKTTDTIKIIVVVRGGAGGERSRQSVEDLQGGANALYGIIVMDLCPTFVQSRGLWVIAMSV